MFAITLGVITICCSVDGPVFEFDIISVPELDSDDDGGKEKVKTETAASAFAVTLAEDGAICKRLLNRYCEPSFNVNEETTLTSSLNVWSPVKVVGVRISNDNTSVALIKKANIVISDICW